MKNTFKKIVEDSILELHFEIKLSIDRKITTNFKNGIFGKLVYGEKSQNMIEFFLSSLGSYFSPTDGLTFYANKKLSLGYILSY